MTILLLEKPAMVFFALFSVLGYATFLHLILKRHLELGIFVSVASIVASLYLFALLGYLQIAAQALFYLGLILLIVNLLLYGFKFRQLGKDLLSPGVVIFAGLSVLYWLRFQGVTYGEDGDVLSHWALATKEMLLTNDLRGNDSAITLKDYPPGVHLFHYFVILNTISTEGAVFFAHFLLLTAPLVGLLKGLSWRQPHWIVLIVATMFYLIHALGLGVITLRIDHLISVYFAMILVYYFTSEWKKVDWLLLVPIFFIMPLIKNVAHFLGILAILVIVGDLVLSGLLYYWNRSNYFFNPAFSLKREIVWAIGIGWFLCIFTIFADSTWNQRVETLGIVKNLRVPQVSVSQITRAFSEEALPKEKAVLENFSKALIQPAYGTNSDKKKIFDKIYEKTGVDLSQWGFLNWTVLLSILERAGIVGLIFLLAFIQANKEYKIHIAFAFISLVLAFVAFLFALLLYYLFVFGQHEGVQLASVYRYTNTFLLALNLIGFAFIFLEKPGKAAQEKRNSRQGVFVFCGILVMLLYFGAPPASRGFLSRQPGYIASRQMTRSQIDFIFSKVEEGAKIYPLFQPLQKEIPLVASKGIKYDLLPLQTNVPCPALGEPAYPEDIWTCDWSATEWAHHLQQNHYQYVYLAKVDPGFWNKYGMLFDPRTEPSDFLFKIQEDLPQQPLFIPVR